MTLSEIRSQAAQVRWGETVGRTKQVRVTVDAFDALQKIPERDRRKLISDAIQRAVKEYNKSHSP